MDEKIFISEKDFLNSFKNLNELGFADQSKLSVEQISNWYNQFIGHNREDGNPELVELSRGLLSSNDKKLGFVTAFATSLLVTGWGSGISQLSPEMNAKIGKVIWPYFSTSNIGASSVIMGFSTITAEGLASLAESKGKEKLARGVRCSLPAMGAITAAIYQYIAEFKYPGVFDPNDIMYGILAVGTGYIGARVTGNWLSESIFKVRPSREIHNFVEENLFLDEVIVEPEIVK